MSTLIDLMFDSFLFFLGLGLLCAIAYGVVWVLWALFNKISK